MYKKNDCIAMLLAGGQGSRLGVLTKNIAKPAVPFGGKYRIIDFPLSNCINSGIETVGVLTQYQPYVLHHYIGSGQPWDLDRLHGGVSVLPPYERGKDREWYKGTANAIYQNINYIDMKNPKYVAVLSGDHIYKMDYHKMLQAHIQNDAACTIAVLHVSLEEASRFGIMNTYDDGRIYEFEEKPAQPKSNKASMGVYIFTWEKLRAYLIADEADPNSSNDFGKNVIPAMLGAGERMFAYDFHGYWKDVGTIDSLWEANMDLLTPNVLNLHDKSWRIFASNHAQPPHYVGENAQVKDSLITEGGTVEGSITRSILYSGATVEEGAAVSYSAILPGAVVGKDATVQYAIVAEDVHIEEGAIIGAAPKQGDKPAITVIGNGVTIGRGAVIPAGSMIAEDVPAAKEE